LLDVTHYYYIYIYDIGTIVTRGLYTTEAGWWKRGELGAWRRRYNRVYSCHEAAIRYNTIHSEIYTVIIWRILFYKGAYFMILSFRLFREHDEPRSWCHTILLWLTTVSSRCNYIEIFYFSPLEITNAWSA